MRIIKIITAFILVLTMLSGTCFAGGDNFSYDVDGIMDSIFRFDVGDFTQKEETAINQDYRIDLLCILGLMKKNAEGNFDGNRLLSYNDFSETVAILTLGGNIFEDVDYKERNVTFGEALEMLISALGYDYFQLKYDSAENWIELAAIELKLLRNLDYSASKLITRLDFAILLSNALDTDIASERKTGKYEIQKGVTLLNKRFEVYKVEGLFNAVQGLDVYGRKGAGKGRIEIDKAEFKTGALTGYRSFLGKRVAGYAKYDDDSDEYTLLSLRDANEENYVEIKFEDVVRFSGNTLFCDIGEGEMNISLGDVKYILYNGSKRVNYDFLNDIADKEGTILLSRESKNGNFDIMVVKNYGSFLIGGYATLDESLKLAYGAAYNLNTSVNVADEGGRIVYIELDGKESTRTDAFKPNYALSCYQNDDESYTELIISTKQAEGTITQTKDSRTVLIGEEEYKVSNEYYECSQNTASSAKPITIDSAGVFYITANDYIAGYKSDNDKSFGYLKAMSVVPGISGRIQVKVFTQDSRWGIFDINSSVTLDGAVYTNQQQIYEYLNSNQILESAISYKFNSKGIYSMDTPKKNMTLDAAIDSKAEWLNGWSLIVGTGPEEFKYRMNDSTVVFQVPRDKAKEEQYSVATGETLLTGSDFNYQFFNTDEFFIAECVLASAAGASLNTKAVNTPGRYVFAESISKAYEEDEVIHKLNGIWINADSATVSYTKVSWYLNTVLHENIDFKAGAIYNVFVGNDNYITSAAKFFDPDEIDDDYMVRFETATRNWTSRYLGTILDVDPTIGQGMYLLNIDYADGTSKQTSFRLWKAVAVLENGKLHEASVSEINKGDRVWLIGRRGAACITVILR